MKDSPRRARLSFLLSHPLSLTLSLSLSLSPQSPSRDQISFSHHPFPGSFSVRANVIYRYYLYCTRKISVLPKTLISLFKNCLDPAIHVVYRRPVLYFTATRLQETVFVYYYRYIIFRRGRCTRKIVIRGEVSTRPFKQYLYIYIYIYAIYLLYTRYLNVGIYLFTTERDDEIMYVSLYRDRGIPREYDFRLYGGRPEGKVITRVKNRKTRTRNLREICRNVSSFLRVM